MTYYNLQTRGRPVRILDEGVPIAYNVDSIDFVGSGVTGTAVGSSVTETITAGGSTTTQVVGEVPSGDVNGVNKDFTLAHTPVSGLAVYVGSRYKITDDYTITGATISFVSAPTQGSNILVDYNY